MSAIIDSSNATLVYPQGDSITNNDGSMDTICLSGNNKHDAADQDVQNERRLQNHSAINYNSLQTPTIIMSNRLTPATFDNSMFNDDSYEGHSDQFDEHEMSKRLSAVESSFIQPDLSIQSYATQHTNEHKPDAGHDGTAPDIMPRAEYNNSAISDVDQKSPFRDSSSQWTGSVNPCSCSDVNLNHEVERATNIPLNAEMTLSSPTVAAVARTMSRIASSNTQQISADIVMQETFENTTQEEQTPRPGRNKNLIHSNSDDDDERMSTIFLTSQEQGTGLNETVGSMPDHTLVQRHLSPGKLGRPGFLTSKSRGTSQRSSTSSVPRSDYSDTSLGIDYALVTGGALPENIMSRNNSYQVRAHSLSDLVSENGDCREFGYTGQEFATPIDVKKEGEEEASSRPPTAIKIEETGPETPRNKDSVAVPTDTVLARHISKIIIPDSVAREYRSQYVKSPSKMLASVPTRDGKNMTLKEQSSNIERLSKENFDLKLKVMFLSDRLDKLSEEGVRETIKENVELKTALANLQRDNKTLRKKNKELDAKVKDDSERPNTSRSGGSSNFDHGQGWSHRENPEEREEELLYLRERVEEYITEINHLQDEALIREAEKRKMAETVKVMNQGRSDGLKDSDELDVWRDQYESESARRLEAEEDSRKLREELFNVKREFTNIAQHATNLNHLNKGRYIPSSRPQSQVSERYHDRNGAYSAASATSTLVEDLKRESEQLRHENTELRREVGAQTSMLTSRNREKERLYLEIEELKLGHRRNGGSMAGDSILERSASRAYVRSVSRASSGRPKHNGIDDDERNDYEHQLSVLRDAMTEHRLKRRELQESLDQTEADFELHLEEKEQMIADMRELAATIESLEEELQVIQTERDSLLQQHDLLEEDYHNLKTDAEQRLEDADINIEQKINVIEKLDAELADRNENFAALQNEMRAMNDDVARLQKDQEDKIERLNALQSEVEEGNREYEAMQAQLEETNEKLERLTIQQENSAGEISFLREEQESDKVKIGELETANASMEKNLADQIRYTKELTDHHENERTQWAEIDGKNKEQTNSFINSLNRQIEAGKDDARKAHARAQSEETESAAWKARLEEFENNLGVALGVLNVPRASLLKSVEELQRGMERTGMELSDTRNKLNEQIRLVKQRDSLLESQSLENRKTNDALGKERQLHGGTKHQFEQYQKQHAHASRLVTQQETRMLELEANKAADRKRFIQLENSFKAQLDERNQYLLILWNRLSALCGTEWSHNNSLINGRALPTLEAIMTMLPGFSKNLFAAVKCIETIIGNFKTKVKAIERDMMKEIHNLEMTLDARTKKLNHLELVVKSGGVTNATGFSGHGVQMETKAELVKLRDANIMLKQELANLRNVNMSPRASKILFDDGSPSPAPSVPMGPGGDMSRTSKIPQRQSRLEKMASSASLATQKALIRSPSRAEDGRDSIRFSPAKSSFDVVQSEPLLSDANDPSALREYGGGESNALGRIREPERATMNIGAGEGNSTGGDQKWVFRLKEMERRLRLEREARLMDRNGARQRLEDAAKIERELRAEIDRAKYREDAQDGEEATSRRRLKESAFE